MSGWAQVAVLVGLSLAATVLALWVMRRAWMADEYRGHRRRTGPPPSQGRHRRDGTPEETTRRLDLSAIRSARARVRRSA